YARDMFAHVGSVRATARQLELGGHRKKTAALPADPFHDALREPPSQKRDQRIQRAPAVAAHGPPARHGHRRYLERDLAHSQPTRRNLHNPSVTSPLSPC